MNQMEKYYAVLCPWCTKSYTIIENIANTKISNRCSVCDKYYEVDCNTMSAKKTKPISNKMLYFIQAK